MHDFHLGYLRQLGEQASDLAQRRPSPDAKLTHWKRWGQAAAGMLDDLADAIEQAAEDER